MNNQRGLARLTLVIMALAVLAFGQAPRALKEKIDIPGSSGHRFPTTVHTDTVIGLKTGSPPIPSRFDKNAVKADLQPETALPVGPVRYHRLSDLNRVQYSFAHMMASYQALLASRQAEAELRALKARGASETEIEAFKLQADGEILQARRRVIEHFGSPEQRQEVDRAIEQYNRFRNEKEVR